MPKIEKLSTKRNKRLISVVILAMVLVAAIVMFRGAGNWLIKEDPLMHADVLAVLSGGMPYRAEAAARLF